MLARNPDHHFMFALADLQRAVRAYADQKAKRHGITRAQWAVLVKLQTEEGLQQAKLAKLLDIQPISLTRLVDRLCTSGLVERRADEKDRRANRLYLTPAARPLMVELRSLRDEINADRARPSEARRGRPLRRPARTDQGERTRRLRGRMRGAQGQGAPQWLIRCLKFPGEQAAPAAEVRKKPLSGYLNKSRRLILLVIIPVIAAIAVLAVYLSGGRYMTTDNAYVGAQKVLVTPDISGKIAKVVVREGQRVQVGDVLFEIDAEPFRLALQQAEARLANVRTDHANLLTNDRAMSRMIELAQKTADIKRQDVERKIDADGQPQRLAVRPRLVERTARRRANAGRAVEPAAGRHPQPVARRTAICRWRNFRRTCRRRPRSTRRSAISIIRPCARRSPATRRRSTTSRSAATSTPARRC